MKKKKKKLNLNEFEAADPWKKKAMLSREIAKNLLPELHIKTHFQAATCISNNLPCKIKLILKYFCIVSSMCF